MKARIEVARASQAGQSERVWEAKVVGQPARALRRVGGFPAPLDAAEFAALPDEVRQLLDVGVGGLPPVRKRFLDIAGGAPRAEEALSFGRYLLETLIGQTAWAALRAQCPANESLRLSLQWDPADWELARLPWEMMADERGFLAASIDPPVSILREIPVAGAAAGPTAIPLRVLFVVASALSDPKIRAGAEYLGLLRQLRSQELAFSHRLVLSANIERLMTAVEQFKPTVLHFIGHGDWGSIRLQPSETAAQAIQKQGYEPWTAKGLVEAFRARQVPLPHVVVLNACDSSSGRPPTPAETVAGVTGGASFAAELSSLGVPMVIGMGGRVADHACRLFTRRFYSALLEPSDGAPADVADATAEGRRAALVRFEGKLEGADWALPHLLVRADADSRLTLQDLEQLRLREEVARRLRKNTSFCDRLDAFQAFEDWMYSRDAGRTVFAIVESEQRPAKGKLGTTRLLSEFAAHAVYAGFAPVVLPAYEPEPPDDPKPPDITRVLRKLNDVVLDTWRWWNLPQPTSTEVDKLTPESLRPRLIRNALALDLHALGQALAPKGQRVMLMVDELHKLGLALPLLARVLQDGLDHLGHRVLVVVSCRRCPGSTTTDEVLKNLLESQTTRSYKLETFPPEQQALAYQQFLILRTPAAFVPNPNMAGANESVERIFHKRVEGIPSRLHEDPRVEDAVDILLDAKVLQPADDEKTMEELARR